MTGALMLTMFPFRVGDTVIVGNVPGKILEINTFYTRVLNDSGSETILPNTAVIGGSVPVTRLASGDSVSSRLEYSVGDRVYTNYIGGEGIVTEITPFSTKVHLDSGKDAKIPNNGIFSGAIHIAKVGGRAGEIAITLKVEGDAEKAIEAMMKVAKSEASLFTSAPVVRYSSLDGPVVELKVSCEVVGGKTEEAKSALLRAAYLASH
jgi:small-conductance mechanosensitive channel